MKKEMIKIDKKNLYKELEAEIQEDYMTQNSRNC